MLEVNSLLAVLFISLLIATLMIHAALLIQIRNMLQRAGDKIIMQGTMSVHEREELARNVASAILGLPVVLSDQQLDLLYSRLYQAVVKYEGPILTRIADRLDELKRMPLIVQMTSAEDLLDTVTHEAIKAPARSPNDLPPMGTTPPAVPLMPLSAYVSLAPTQQKGYLLALGNDSQYARWYRGESGQVDKNAGRQ